MVWRTLDRVWGRGGTNKRSFTLRERETKGQRETEIGRTFVSRVEVESLQFEEQQQEIQSLSVVYSDKKRKK
jgi:hypothetical protein